MGLSVAFVSGPRRSGKSAVIRTMIDHVWSIAPHYVRLVSRDSDKTLPHPTKQSPQSCGVASARWVTYDAEHIFEVLQDALADLEQREPNPSVIVEADADPALRCAYPYDRRIFVMPLPGRVDEVFREARQAANELQRALDDTVAFASEMFGLDGCDGPDEVDPHEDRADLSDSQMRAFLYSPLGDELATRMQLQTPYHALVESDVIVINTTAGQRTTQTDGCVRRVEQLLKRLKKAGNHRSMLVRCDPASSMSRESKTLIKALKPMCQGA